MQQAVQVLLRQGRQRLPQLLLPAAWRCAHTAVEPAAVNPFLRFSTPLPKAIDHTPLLSTLPETQVRRGATSPEERDPPRVRPLVPTSSSGAVAHHDARGRMLMLNCRERALPMNCGHDRAMQVTTLPNGLRVATEQIPFAETATVGVWINSGSRFETDETNGAAHFLEHILFKGTKARAMVAAAVACSSSSCAHQWGRGLRSTTADGEGHDGGRACPPRCAAAHGAGARG